MVRAGSTLLLIHELADVSIETAKLSKYTGHRQVCTVLLVIFSIIWLVTRVSVFPFYYIRRFSLLCFPFYVCVLICFIVSWQSSFRIDNVL